MTVRKSSPSSRLSAIRQIELTTQRGPTIPLGELAGVSHTEAAETSARLLKLSAILGPSFPHAPVELGGTTAAPAGTSVGVNAMLERTILAQRQANEWLDRLIAAMGEYLGEEQG